MYNAHRGMVQPPSSSNNRLSELFDQIRREFETHAQDRAGEHDQTSEFLLLSGLISQKFGTCAFPLPSSSANANFEDPFLFLSPAGRDRGGTYMEAGKHGD